MGVLVLRIKKGWFDEISSGRKTAEFRADTKRYKAVFKRPYRFAIFHYQKQPRLLCRVKSIKRIKNRLSAAAKQLVRSEYVWRIDLSHPITINAPTTVLKRLLGSE